MIKDKFSAVWVSHSSISDYLKCPRAYFLKNIYRNPKSGHKVQLMQPALALGQVVHDTLDSLMQLKSESRFTSPLVDRFYKQWQKVTGKSGGFIDAVEEENYKERGKEMILRVQKHPGPLANKAVKLRQELPYYWFSEEDNLILCGKIDWLEYFPESDSVHIIDFKTGKFDEDPDSLQMLIYFLLVKNTQNRKIAKMSYWYLDRDNEVTDIKLPDEMDALKQILEVAKTIALARKLEHFKCRQKSGCRACLPYEEIVNNNAEFVGVGSFSQDVYILPQK